MIEGNEAANDALLEAWPFSRTTGMPVWHLHESIERLVGLAHAWPSVALGSSGQYQTPGTAQWWGRMQQVTTHPPTTV